MTKKTTRYIFSYEQSQTKFKTVICFNICLILHFVPANMILVVVLHIKSCENAKPQQILQDQYHIEVLYIRKVWLQVLLNKNKGYIDSVYKFEVLYIRK